MIQEIRQSVKCQKLNKFINRNRKLSVKQPNSPDSALPGRTGGGCGVLSPVPGTRRALFPAAEKPPENCFLQGSSLFPGDMIK